MQTVQVLRAPLEKVGSNCESVYVYFKPMLFHLILKLSIQIHSPVLQYFKTWHEALCLNFVWNHRICFWDTAQWWILADSGQPSVEMSKQLQFISLLLLILWVCFWLNIDFLDGVCLAIQVFKSLHEFEHFFWCFKFAFLCTLLTLMILCLWLFFFCSILSKFKKKNFHLFSQLLTFFSTAL